MKLYRRYHWLPSLLYTDYWTNNRKIVQMLVRLYGGVISLFVVQRMETRWTECRASVSLRLRPSARRWATKGFQFRDLTSRSSRQISVSAPATGATRLLVVCRLVIWWSFSSAWSVSSHWPLSAYSAADHTTEARYKPANNNAAWITFKQKHPSNCSDNCRSFSAFLCTHSVLCAALLCCLVCIK